MAGSVRVFTITADSQFGPCRTTRTLPASAMCLADAWAGYRHTNIFVTDALGVALDREAFRATLPLIRRMAERRR